MHNFIGRKIDSLVIYRGIAAVDVVPPVAGEFLLIENRAVGAQERRSLLAFPTVVAHVINLLDNEMTQRYNKGTSRFIDSSVN